ncbi:Beta-galactosidase [Lutibacter agarilyticus]|uniref:Beta-galactosidase n=1 Tax=Lutibacter agarilyticus TaxID=1109740 RepID=A0A238X7S3_9FLAO|nr:beta-galactosidase [Lutibacter agarilyticus]SNR54384.1 Beta-galactosidase [Lutibacter agarilyticus]
MKYWFPIFSRGKLLILILVIQTTFTYTQENFVKNLDDHYLYWGSYHKTPISDIQNPKWVPKETVIEGWDWLLPESVKPSKLSNLCIARNFGLDNRKIEQLPEVNFKTNPVISHWVKWRELEPIEGEINFEPLIENIKNASEKGYGSIIRIHFSATDFAPEWVKKYNIPIRKEQKENSQKRNYEVSHPEFHERYLKFVKALGESGIPKMKEVKGLFLGYASPSNGDEGIGPYPEGNVNANDTIQHVRERIDAWANACKGVEQKVFMGGMANYGFNKGFGIRRGFVEMYLYHIPDEHIGQEIDANGYLIVEESNNIINKNLFHGEENEEYEEKWATTERGFRFGINTEPYPYRYFTANLRLLQMRCNYLLNNEFSLLPEMLSWVSLELGKTIEDAPDAWCFLRESYLKGNKARPVKNFERWVYQRDYPGYETKPVAKIDHPIKMWMVQPDMYYDYVARKGNKIGFDVDDNFLSANRKFAVKISYMDVGHGNWSLVFQGEKRLEERKLKSENSGKIKTATLFITADFKNKTLPFDLEIHGEGDFEPTISFLRVIKV